MKQLADHLENHPSRALEEAMGIIRDKAQALRFGTITLTLHEGRLTQLDINEKRRFAP